MVVFKNVVSLCGLDGRAEEHEPFRRQALSNRHKQRLRIRQVLGKHGRYDPLILSLASRLVCFQGILNRELDTISVSGDSEQTIRYSHRWRADVHTFDLNVPTLLCR